MYANKWQVFMYRDSYFRIDDCWQNDWLLFGSASKAGCERILYATRSEILLICYFYLFIVSLIISKNFSLVMLFINCHGRWNSSLDVILLRTITELFLSILTNPEVINLWVMCPLNKVNVFSSLNVKIIYENVGQLSHWLHLCGT